MKYFVLIKQDRGGGAGVGAFGCVNEPWNSLQKIQRCSPLKIIVTAEHIRQMSISDPFYDVGSVFLNANMFPVILVFWWARDLLGINPLYAV